MNNKYRTQCCNDPKCTKKGWKITSYGIKRDECNDQRLKSIKRAREKFRGDKE